MPIPVIRSIWLVVAFIELACVRQSSGEIFLIAQSASGTVSPSIDLNSLRKQALEEAEAGKTDDAIRDYRRALEFQPEWKEGLWNLGMLQYNRDRFAEARSTFQKLVEVAPGLGNAWSLLGLSEYENGDYDDALAHLEKAQFLGIKDDAEIARVSSYHLGLLYVRAGEFERASALLLSTFGSGLVSPQAKIGLGLAMLRIPLLPEQLDPSREALVLAAGDAATAGNDELVRLAALLRAYPDVPYLHYAFGLALAKEGREKEALEQIRAETGISPDSPMPWIELSRLELRQEEVNESLKAAQQAVRLSPDNRDAHKAFAEALEAAGRGEQAAAERKFVAPAIDGLPMSRQLPERRIVLLYANASAAAMTGTASEDARQRWNRAMQEYTAGQYSAADADLKAWLAVTPESGTGWALLGLSEFELKDFDNALIHLDRGAKLGLSASPESLALAKYTYGILLVRAGQFEQAAEVLASASNATGTLSAKVQYELGLVLLRKAEFPDTGSTREATLVTAAGRIELLLLQSKYDEAFPQFKLLLDRYPATPFLHYAYGTALIALSEFDQATVQMQAEMAISPRSELPLVRLASIALRQHDPTTAIAWSERALGLAPASVEAHYLLGRACLETGDLAAAMRELEIAEKLSPASPEVHFNLAKAYAHAKMTEKAQYERDTFSRLNQAAESQRSLQSSQVDLGTRGAADVTTTSPVEAPSRPPFP
jgi:tetratricopeptide (TPR) repeat protein